MNYVVQACDPYPSSVLDSSQSDLRRSQYLTEVLDRLTGDELREIARVLGNLYPRAFEQQLQWIQQDRDRPVERRLNGESTGQGLAGRG